MKKDIHWQDFKLGSNKDKILVSKSAVYPYPCSASTMFLDVVIGNFLNEVGRCLIGLFDQASMRYDYKSLKIKPFIAMNYSKVQS